MAKQQRKPYTFSEVKTGPLPLRKPRGGNDALTEVAKKLQPNGHVIWNSPPTHWRSALKTLQKTGLKVDGYLTIDGDVVLYHTSRNEGSAMPLRHDGTQQVAPPVQGGLVRVTDVRQTRIVKALRAARGQSLTRSELQTHLGGSLNIEALNTLESSGILECSTSGDGRKVVTLTKFGAAVEIP